MTGGEDLCTTIFSDGEGDFRESERGDILYEWI